MSLYNMLHGMDPYAGLYLHMLNLNWPDIARLRDCHLSGDGKHIYLLTRTGGGNREEYSEWWREIRKHPNYISDRDDDYDSTFATTTFSAPGHVVEELERDPRTKDIVSAFRRLFEKERSA